MDGSLDHLSEHLADFSAEGCKFSMFLASDVTTFSSSSGVRLLTSDLWPLISDFSPLISDL